MLISAFDAADDATARGVARVWADIPWWMDAVVAGRPYGSVAALIEGARQAAQRWTAADLDAALARHPRIGERPTGAGAEADASRREQAAMAGASEATAARLAEVQTAYEARFGRVFLIRAAGRSADEMLDEALRRAQNDVDTEVAEALGQLREIALLRLRGDIHDDTADLTCDPEETA